MSDEETRVRARLREFADSVTPISDLPAVGRARYRRRVRRQRAAAVLAGVLVVVGASGLGVALTRGPSHSVQVGTRGGSSTSVTARPPSPARAIVDATWISDDAGWALLHSTIVHTTDGGRTWNWVSAAPSNITHIRFADALHGWLFGDAFFSTDDGGATWTREPARPVVAFEVAHGRAYRLVAEGDGCPGPCGYRVETARVGTASWNRVSPDIGGNPTAQLLYDGPRLYVASYGSAMNRSLHLVVSTDAGANWRQRSNPCTEGTDDVPVQLATAPNGFVVALCRHNAGGTYVRTSTDAAATFGPARSLPRDFSAPGEGGVAIAAGSPGSIMVVGFVDASWVLDVSHDAGVSWNRTLSGTLPQGDDGVAFLGFEDAKTGRVAVMGDRLWTTRDGGDTWTVGRP